MGNMVMVTLAPSSSRNKHMSKKGGRRAQQWWGAKLFNLLAYIHNQKKGKKKGVEAPL